MALQHLAELRHRRLEVRLGAAEDGEDDLLPLGRVDEPDKLLPPLVLEHRGELPVVPAAALAGLRRRVRGAVRLEEPLHGVVQRAAGGGGGLLGAGVGGPLGELVVPEVVVDDLLDGEAQQAEALEVGRALQLLVGGVDVADLRGRLDDAPCGNGGAVIRFM